MTSKAPIIGLVVGAGRNGFVDFFGNPRIEHSLRSERDMSDVLHHHRHTSTRITSKW